MIKMTFFCVSTIETSYVNPTRVGSEVERKCLGAVVASPELALLCLRLTVISMPVLLAKVDAS